MRFFFFRGENSFDNKPHKYWELYNDCSCRDFDGCFNIKLILERKIKYFPDIKQWNERELWRYWECGNGCCTARPVLKEERNLGCNNRVCKKKKTTQNFQVICKINKRFLPGNILPGKKGNTLLFQIWGGKALLDSQILWKNIYVPCQICVN